MSSGLEGAFPTPKELLGCGCTLVLCGAIVGGVLVWLAGWLL
jgi:hypothetical protein